MAKTGTAVGFAFAALLTSTALAVPVTTTVGGTNYTVQGLVGVGRMASNLRDQHGETFGSISGLTANFANWTVANGVYSGQFFALPDRGFNVAGTTDYAPRLNTINFTFTPTTLTSTGNAQNQVQLSLASSQRFFENTANGPQFLSGLDPLRGGVATGGARAATASLPELPQAFNGKLSLDPEAVVRFADGSMLIADEYGPSIYRFNPAGQFVGALKLPAHLTPQRNGASDYSSNNVGAGQPVPSPTDPTSGRQNNQGLEGLSLAPDGKTLIAVLQSATRQDLNTASANTSRRNTRALTFDVSDIDNPVLTGEYAVQLPTYLTGGGNVRIAAQSEIIALSATRFLILPRDGNGFGTSDALSRYRDVDIVDLGGATNLVGNPLQAQIAPNGVLNSTITPATLSRWLDINNIGELSRFGLRNGGVNDTNNLSEKWEGLTLLSALDAAAPDDYFLFVANDNDFLTTTGFQVGSPYNAGVDVDTMFLVYRVTLPGFSQQAFIPEPGMALLFAGAVGALGFARRRKRA
jgi:hypothetical protein